MARCRLCTSNDRDALILSLAQDLWASVAPHDPVELKWERADYWRPIYLSLATRAVESLEREHGLEAEAGDAPMRRTE